MDLYKLSYNNKPYYFTSFQEDLEVDGIIYKAIPISRKEMTMEVKKGNFTVTAPLRVEPFTTMSSSNSAFPIICTVVSYPEMVTLFEGVAKKLKHNYTKGTVDIELISKLSNLSGKVPKRTYSISCPYQLGSKECGINMDDYKTVLGPGEFSIDGLKVTADIFSTGNSPTDEYYTGGYLKASTGEYQYILKQNATDGTATLLFPLAHEDEIDYLEVYPGCDKKLETCESLFNNKCNFGGFPYIPNNNPVSQGF